MAQNRPCGGCYRCQALHNLRVDVRNERMKYMFSARHGETLNNAWPLWQAWHARVTTSTFHKSPYHTSRLSNREVENSQTTKYNRTENTVREEPSDEQHTSNTHLKISLFPLSFTHLSGSNSFSTMALYKSVYLLTYLLTYLLRRVRQCGTRTLRRVMLYCIVRTRTRMRSPPRLTSVIWRSWNHATFFSVWHTQTHRQIDTDLYK